MSCSLINTAGYCTIGPCGGGDQPIPAMQFDASYAAEAPYEGDPPPSCPDGKCDKAGCQECEAAAGH